MGTRVHPELTSHGQIGNSAARTAWTRRATASIPPTPSWPPSSMQPKAYAIDYIYDTRAKTSARSKACSRGGVRLGFAAEARAKHIMRLEDLEKVDPNRGVVFDGPAQRGPQQNPHSIEVTDDDPEHARAQIWGGLNVAIGQDWDAFQICSGFVHGAIPMPEADSAS